ncbi:MAG: DNA topoisomerase III [Desulfobulbaceae bacterium]|jgi:DNA topoisomerase-3|nr:DNA topoisomerase III [Desulfobulbaceae bacterium]
MTEKILVIAEKPSVASDLAKVLPDKFTRAKTHYEGERYIVSYAVGHLVTICFPEEIDPIYQKWNIDYLPIIPENFPLKVIEDSKSQFAFLQKQIRRKDVTTIVNACDAGREGELIFKYIVRLAANTGVMKKSFKRLWLQSMTTDAIKEGFAHLRDDSEMRPLEDTALCRSESDWLVGINATRALTGYNSRRGGFFLTPCGRVQTPTLSLMVKRERQRLAFVSQPYWLLTATFAHAGGKYQGRWIDPAFKADEKNLHARQDRLWDKTKTEAIAAKCQGRPATVTESSKEARQGAPQLYDLTSLQREANSRYGFSAKNTLALAQSLYERHKALTYPRTDSRYLPEDYLDTAKKAVGAMKFEALVPFAQTALAKKYLHSSKRIFDNKKISDHHAIIPTVIQPKGLSEAELKIYLLVARRFLAVFFPPAVYLHTRRESLVEGELFLTEGKILLEAGWKAIYGAEEQDEDEATLKALPKQAAVSCRDLAVEEKQTAPPPRYTEATLLSAMDNSGKLVEDEELAEAMKERGLGTPATRAAIIEKLLKEKYLAREGKDLAPTGKAFDLLALLEAMQIDVLASPEMTGEWEFKLNQILAEKMSRDQFMAEIKDLTCGIIKKITGFQSEGKREEAAFSPLNGKRVFVTPTAYASEDGAIRLKKVLGGRVMRDEEIAALLRGETIGPFADFRSKKGKPFAACLCLKNNKVEFIFADGGDGQPDAETVKAGESLGKSPIDDSPVFATPKAYVSISALDGDDKKGLRINRTILAKEISPDHIRELLKDGKTSLISGFISKRKRPFDAWLLLDKNGKLSFEFPPRVSRKKAAKKS